MVPFIGCGRACVPAGEEIAALAAADFHASQTVYQEELQCLERSGPYIYYIVAYQQLAEAVIVYIYKKLTKCLDQKKN